MSEYLSNKFEISEMIDTGIESIDGNRIYSYIIKARGKTIMNYDTSKKALSLFLDAQTDALHSKYGDKYKIMYNTNVDVGAGLQPSKFSDTSEIYVYDIYVSYEGIMHYIKERVDDEVYLKYENVLKQKKEDIKFVNNEFIVNVYKQKTNLSAGGCSENQKNDCLFYCIQHALSDTINLPWKYPSTFKTKFLELSRNDMVDISYIPTIEQKLKTHIEIEGDVFYKTKEPKYSRNVKFSLINNHYKNTFNKTTMLCKKMNTPCSNFIVYDNYYYYDSLSTKSKGKYDFVKNTPKDLLCFYCIPKMSMKYSEYKEPLKEIYEQIHKDRLIILDKLKLDVFDYKTIKNCALSYFNDTAKTLKQPDELTQEECKFIELTKCGALRYAKKGSYKHAYYYDFNAFYDHVMLLKSFYLPTKEPTCLIINEINKEYVPYGYYHCIINEHPLFTIHKSNWYTHYDIESARILKLNISLICNEEYNFIHYDNKKRVKGCDIFSTFINSLYNLKNHGCKIINKTMIKTLHGSLVEYNHLFKYLGKKETYVIPEEYNIEELCYDEKQNINIKMKHKINIFLYPYARMKNFLVSCGKLYLIKTLMKCFDNNIDEIIKNVVYIHTDGFACITNISDKLSMGDKIGEIKIEHEGDVNVKNMNTLIWS